MVDIGGSSPAAGGAGCTVAADGLADPAEASGREAPASAKVLGNGEGAPAGGVAGEGWRGAGVGALICGAAALSLLTLGTVRGAVAAAR